MSTKWATLELVNVDLHKEVPQTIDLSLPFILLGRKNKKINVDIAIEDDQLSLSRNHCTFQRKDYGEYYIIDNKSANGTFVNFVKVNKMQIHDGDLIILGAGPFIRVGQDIRQVFAYIKDHPNDPKLFGFHGPRTKEEMEKYCIVFRFRPNKNATGTKRPRSEDMEEDVIDEQIVNKRKVELDEVFENKKMEFDTLFKKEIDEKKKEVDVRKSKIEQVKKGENEFKRKIELELRCDICQEIFLKPITLPCGHAVCCTCLRDYFNSRKEKECCRCRQSVKDQPNWPVRNFFLDDMITKMIPHLTEIEREGYEERVEEMKEQEQESMTLYNNLKQANPTPAFPKYDDKNQEWKDQEKTTVRNHLSKFRGEARVKYLTDLGYSEQWVNTNFRNGQMMSNVAKNLGMKVSDGNCADCNTSMPVNPLRMKQTMLSFIRDEYIDFS